MTGSFLFVKPSDPEGKPGTAYSEDSSQYPYDRASWEWLLERALRRTLIPWAITESHSRVLLHGHEDQYSMHRWGSYGVSNSAGTTPLAYTNVGGPGSYQRKTDADLSGDYRTAQLPISWDSYQKAPVLSSTIVTYGIDDLEKMVADLPFSLEWLHPDWLPDSLKAWNLTAKTTEETMGTAKNYPYRLNWTWKTTVKHEPYEIPNDIPFKCLSHMRTDDPIVTVTIKNDDDESIEVETAPTPVSAPMAMGGSVRDYHDTQVRGAVYGAAYKAGWALPEFSILYVHGLDYSESTGETNYCRGDKTEESYKGVNATLGSLVDIPDKTSGNITVSYVSSNGSMARFVPNVDWGGKPTYWHAKAFPKGIDSVISPKLKDQLKALCPLCQPAIPPAIPALRSGFPDTERLQWVHSSELNVMYPGGWVRHLELACTPFDMSARLDAMTTTVHSVPSVFAKIKTVSTYYHTTDSDITESYRSWWRKYVYSKEVTVEGTSTSPIQSGSGYDINSVSSQLSTVKNVNSSYTYSYGGTSSSSSETRETHKESFESESEYLVCLRSTNNTKPSTKTTTKTETWEETTYTDKPITSKDETVKGNIPDSYDPDPDDLLFPDWVLPWIETAELFVSIDSRLGRGSYADTTTTKDYQYRAGEGRKSFYSGSGSGSRTHKAHRKIVSLGQMDTSTGRFPAIDAAEIISGVDPDPTEFTAATNVWGSHSSTTTDTTDSDGNNTTKVVEVKKGNVYNTRDRSVSYYVVVKWNFDRLNPETLETEDLETGTSLASLYRDHADAKKELSDKTLELSDANKALSTAQADLKSAKDALERAQEQFADPGGAEAELLEEAEAALESTKQALSEAQEEKSNATSEYAVAESASQSAESSLQSAQAAYDAAVAEGEGVEEARAALESAYTVYFEAVEAYSEASNKLANAGYNETMAQHAADAAQDYYDTLHDKIEEILQKAVDDAQEAVDEATSMVDEWTHKVEKAEGEIPDLEAAVEAAEKAVTDAGGSVT